MKNGQGKIGKLIPGTFKTDSGQKAVLLHRLRGDHDSPWLGYVVEKGEHVAQTWTDGGKIWLGGRPSSNYDLARRVN